jgi:hypothetical protein
MPILTRKAVILAKKESTKGTDSLPTPTQDAILVSEPSFEIDPNVLERNNVKSSLSQDSIAIGRKLATISFTTELRGNGTQNSGNLNDSPEIGNLMECCGYKATAIAPLSVEQIGEVIPKDNNSNLAPDITFANTTAPNSSLIKPIVYTLEVSVGGQSGTAEITVSPSNNSDVSKSSIVVTSGVTEIELGDNGGGITATWVGDLQVGDKYQVLVTPPGIQYKPTSDDSELKTITIYYYNDGLLYKITGAMGTFTISAESGNYATIEFSFTGQYVEVTDAALPTNAVYNDTLPQQVEYAGLVLGEATECILTASNWSIDQGNTITPRSDICGADGYNGVRLTARAVNGTIDPEATLISTFPFWTEFSQGRRLFYTINQGNESGNRITITVPKAQISGISQGDRDGISVYETDLRFTANKGDDEIIFYFT